MTTKKITATEFINRSKKIHGEKYDYSNVVYHNGKTKVSIICPFHGVFYQRPHNHSKGEGCRSCMYDSVGKKRANSVEYFIKMSRRIHGNKYDYSGVIYENNKVKIRIKCPLHGAFEQTPNNHLRGQTCSECSKTVIADKNRRTDGEFIRDAIKIHGNKYDYSGVIYKTKNDKVVIKCKKHGAFEQNANNHLRGAGCPHCVSSKGEQKVMMVLNSKNIGYECQKRFNDCRSPKGRMLRFDFFIPEKNMLIEYDGPQHFGDLRIGKYTLKQEEYEVLKIHDVIKNEYVSNRGIKMIRIPHWEFNNVDKIISEYL